MEVAKLKAAGGTDVGKLAGSISKNLEEGKNVEITVIGAPAVNQTAKAIATASGHAGAKNKRLEIGIGFTTTEVRDRGTGQMEDRTGMIFSISYK